MKNAGDDRNGRLQKAGAAPGSHTLRKDAGAGMLHLAGCHGNGGGTVCGGPSGERLPEEGIHRQDTPQPVHSDGYGEGEACSDQVPDWQQAVPGRIHCLAQCVRGPRICARCRQRGLCGHGDAVHGLPI